MLKADTRMIITQALAGMESTAAIFFLLTSYFDAVRWHEGAATLPQELLRLPLQGNADVAARHAETSALQSRCLGETGLSSPLLVELSSVLDLALHRLRALQRADAQAGGDALAPRSVHETAPRMPSC
jgi:hypothetical protein